MTIPDFSELIQNLVDEIDVFDATFSIFLKEINTDFKSQPIKLQKFLAMQISLKKMKELKRKVAQFIEQDTI